MMHTIISSNSQKQYQIEKKNSEKAVSNRNTRKKK